MAIELSYLLLTPYSIMKSRTGGVLARLLSRSDLDLVAAQMLAPTAELAEQYAQSIEETIGKTHEKAGKMLSDYVRDNFSPTPDGKKKRVLMLLFHGEDTCRKLFEITGHITPEPVDVKNITGETIRDTYADLILDDDGKVRYFEPAVLTSPNLESAIPKMKLFAKFAASQNNIVHNIVRETEEGERTLAIIKPDNWRMPSSKPGNIIDMFSKTGLRIVGCKIHRMSVGNALEFYGQVHKVLIDKISPHVAVEAKTILEQQFSIALTQEDEETLRKIVGLKVAEYEFDNIIEFMSGIRPEDCAPEKLEDPGKAKCMILIYEGINAIAKIRDVLGPTDPNKAPGGTIRADFGHNIMINTAHGSDSPESVEREMKITRMNQNRLSSLIEEFIENME